MNGKQESYPSPDRQEGADETEIETLHLKVLDEVLERIKGRTFSVYNHKTDQEEPVAVPDIEKILDAPGFVWTQEQNSDHLTVNPLRRILESPEGSRLLDDILKSDDAPDAVKQAVKKRLLSR